MQWWFWISMSYSVVNENTTVVNGPSLTLTPALPPRPIHPIHLSIRLILCPLLLYHSPSLPLLHCISIQCTEPSNGTGRERSSFIFFDSVLHQFLRHPLNSLQSWHFTQLKLDFLNWVMTWLESWLDFTQVNSSVMNTKDFWLIC